MAIDFMPLLVYNVNTYYGGLDMELSVNDIDITNKIKFKLKPFSKNFGSSSSKPSKINLSEEHDFTTLISYHKDALLNEFLNYYNKSFEYIFGYAKSDNQFIPMNIPSQLKLLYEIIGEDSISKRIDRVLKIAFKEACYRVDPTSIFKVNDNLKFQEIEEHRNILWARITAMGSKTSPSRITLQSKDICNMPIRSRFTLKFLLSNNPEYIIRAISEDAIYPSKKTDKEPPSFWDDGWEPDISNRKFSFMELLDQYTSENDNFVALKDTEAYGFIDIKNRIKIFIDLFGRDALIEKLTSYISLIHDIDTDNIINTSIFSIGDIVRFYYDNSIYIVSQVCLPSGEVTITDIKDEDSTFVVTVLDLLKENPQYYSRL